MKALIAISSCVAYALNGSNQVLRETYLQDVSKFPGLDYRIFIGDGTKDAGDTTAFEDSFNTCPWTLYQNKQVEQPPFTYTPKSDEVILQVEDGYKHLAYKTRGAQRWSVEHGFDYTFQCFPDTYIHVPRLIASRFENHDYTGYNANDGWYAGGGPGYWLSRRASEAILSERIDVWFEDMWVGNLLKNKGIAFHLDQRYSDFEAPSKDNDLITCHTGHNEPGREYTQEKMREIYRLNKPPARVFRRK